MFFETMVVLICSSLSRLAVARLMPSPMSISEKRTWP